MSVCPTGKFLWVKPKYLQNSGFNSAFTKRERESERERGQRGIEQERERTERYRARERERTERHRAREREAREAYS